MANVRNRIEEATFDAPGHFKRVPQYLRTKCSWTQAKCFKCCVDFCDNLTVFDPESTLWLTGHGIPISNCTVICVHA